MDNYDLKHIQQIIGYKFQNEDLLQQAFVRRSYSEENGGENNEVLEFIGDKVLDLIVVKLLIEKYGFMLRECNDFDEENEFDEFACEKNESGLTEIKRQLVQGKNLAQRIDSLDFANYLIVGNGDHNKNKNSVKEDLFEAIIGAATIDSNWNLDELQNIVEIMLDPDTVIDDNEENYIMLIQDWALKKGIGIPLYSFEENKNYSNSFYSPIKSINDKLKSKYQCSLTISNDISSFYGYGNSKSEARVNACITAYNYLYQNNLLFSIYDEIPNPTKDNAISQLEILARRGYFSIPIYKFTETHDKNGNPIWCCTGTIKEKNININGTSSSKKTVKKQVAWKMLKQILDIKN